MAGSFDPGSIEVIPEEVKEVGRFAYRIATELRSGSKSLDGEVQGLMTTWRGAAADSYRAGWDEMHAGAVDVWETLFALAAQLGITAENFQATDNSNAAAQNSINLG